MDIPGFVSHTPATLQPPRAARRCRWQLCSTAKPGQRATAAVDTTYSATRWAVFRDTWAGEWAGRWERVDALGNVTATTGVRRIFRVTGEDLVEQRNVVDNPKWHRGGGLERQYTHTRASFDNFPLQTLVNPGGDALQVSRGRFSVIEKTLVHPSDANRRAALVLLYAAGGIGLCTFLTESLVDADRHPVQDASICVDRNGALMDGFLLPPDPAMQDNMLSLALNKGRFVLHCPRDLNKCYGRAFNISMRWTIDGATKEVVVHMDETSKFVGELTTIS